MFYHQNPNFDNFRLGDVVEGLISVTPIINNQIPSGTQSNYNLDINFQAYSVVLTPCCSIEKNSISLCPLIPLTGSFLINPYFAEDFTRVNRLIQPDKFMPPEEWNKVEYEKQLQILSEGPKFGFVDYFIYKGHELFQHYNLKYRKVEKIINDYMIDFRKIHVVRSQDVFPIIKSKKMELTIETRIDLRVKISKYFERVPDEDKLIDL